MPDRYACELALAQAKAEEFKELFHMLSARADDEQRLRADLSRAILEQRERRDGKRFEFTRKQQCLVTSLERDADNVRKGMETQFAQLPTDADLLRLLYHSEKHAVDLDSRLWRDRKGNFINPLVPPVLEYSKETVGMIERFAEARQVRLALF
jgi:hypothetical protein